MARHKGWPSISKVLSRFKESEALMYYALDAELQEVLP